MHQARWKRTCEGKRDLFTLDLVPAAIRDRRSTDDRREPSPIADYRAFRARRKSRVRETARIIIYSRLSSLRIGSLSRNDSNCETRSAVNPELLHETPSNSTDRTSFRDSLIKPRSTRLFPNRNMSVIVFEALCEWNFRQRQER